MRARLINPELVTIRPFRRSAAVVDPLLDEPTAHVDRGTDVTLLGQIEAVSENDRTSSQLGANVRARYRMHFLRSAVEAAGWHPKDGDLVVAVANRDGSQARSVRWYVDGPGHTTREYHRAKLISLDAVDRAPGRVTTEGDGL